MMLNFMQFMFSPQMVALKAVGFSNIITILESLILASRRIYSPS